MSLSLGSTTIGSLYLGSTKIGEAYLGSTKVYASAPSGDPFNVVSDADFDPNEQKRWSEVMGITSGYYGRGYAPDNSMLYRKVHVNSTVRVTEFVVNTNKSPAHAGSGDPYQITANTTYWPACVTLYTMSLVPVVINPMERTDTAYIGTIYNYSSTNDTWYYIHVPCDVTLQPGDYWWPLFVTGASSSDGTVQFGYHSNITGEFMALRKWSRLDDPNYPVLYLGTTYNNPLPYLHVIDSNGNEYSV